MEISWLIVAVASLFGGLGSVLLIGASLAFGIPLRWLTYLLGLAVGTLLGAAFIILLPEAIITSNAETAMAGTLVALLGFFLLEASLRLHTHQHEDTTVTGSAPLIVLVGDAFHHAVDGAAIGAAFIVSAPLGLTTALAVAAHEIPQETGDYAVLVEGGFGVRSAIFWNSLSSLTSLPAALIAFWALSIVKPALPYLLMVGSGAFIYVALADLVPVLHHTPSRTRRLLHMGLVLCGAAIILLLETLL